MRDRRGKVASCFEMGGGWVFRRRFGGSWLSVSSTMEVCMERNCCLSVASVGRWEVVDVSLLAYLEERLCFMDHGAVVFDVEL